MIIGTVSGAWGARYFTDTVGLGLPWGPIMGLLVGAFAGLLFARIHAAATVTFKVDHIVSGVVINLVAIGLARFLSQVFFGQATQSDPGGPHLNPIDIPLLSSLPWGLGRAFQGLSPMVFVAFLVVIPVSYRPVSNEVGPSAAVGGENPEASRSLGVAASRSTATRACCSPARSPASPERSWRSEVIGNWREGQTLGLGFIALAALILSNWNPKRLMFFAWLFGFAQAIPLRLNDAPIINLLPPQFIRMIPYVVTIVAIAGFVGKVRPPAAAGRAYEGGTGI